MTKHPIQVVRCSGFHDLKECNAYARRRLGFFFLAIQLHGTQSTVHTNPRDKFKGIGKPNEA